MKITIDKNIPHPGRKTTLPFSQMEVGDSFLLPEGVSHGYARQLIQHFKKENATFKFSLLRTKEGYRCWRTE